MSSPSTQFVRACSLEELKTKRCVVVRGADRPIAVFGDSGTVVRAVDNRCPHMGFPLSKGTCEDGMITCHWHHARFDASSGCTFDLWADDVEAFDVEVRGPDVFVADLPRRRDPVNHAHRRLGEGLEHNLSLIVAKAILALRAAGVPDADIVREVARFGSRYRDGWAMGQTVLTATANLLPKLGDETAYLALYQGARRVAADCAGQPTRRERTGLASDDIDARTLNRWLAHWALVRHRTGAERTLLTAIDQDRPPREVAQLIFTASTERFLADTGHLLDFANKAFELLDLIGWDHAPQILPTLVEQLVMARGGEELNAWRHPIDLVPMVRDLTSRLPALFESGRDKHWNGQTQLAGHFLCDDPKVILDAVAASIESGAKANQLTKSLAYAAAMRIARFGTANEVSDWSAALHTFTYCNALHQATKRCSGPALVRGVLHGAMSVYLIRFLNVPPARLPGEHGSLGDLPTDPDELRSRFLKTLDRQQQIDEAARLVARYLELRHPVDPLVETLTQAVVREDANFHTFQMLEAAVRQQAEWGDSEQGHQILIAAARYLAAHSPTPRSQLQTAQIALRLHRGESVHEEGA